MPRFERQKLRVLPLLAAFATVMLLGAPPPGALAAAAPPANPHGEFKAECAMCHSAKDWREVHPGAQFDHARFGFPLAAAHAAATCTACHGSLDFTQSSHLLCASCHADPHRGEMGLECARCHGARSFTDRGPMVRAHAQTAFPLTGNHVLVECSSCHRPATQGQLQFAGTSQECSTCHDAKFRAAKNPDHVAQGFPADCRGCHATVTWTAATFDHSRTAFPLTGVHQATACASCHTGGSLTALDTRCQSCHQADYTGAPIDHAAAGFQASACAGCHGTTSFAGGAFNHGATSFALTGAHTAANCRSCHGDGVFSTKLADCYSCHAAAYAAAAPGHEAAGFAAGLCASCHTTTSFAGGRFDHNTTSFALAGAHANASCQGCHANGIYRGRSHDCISCHQADYDAATPNHATSGFAASQCATCHTTVHFAGAVFDHAATRFALTGAHASTTCQSCHADGVYHGRSTDCYSCHVADYTAATVNHAAAGFATDRCVTCHSTSTFRGGTFNHATTSFALTGSHVGRACADCHGDGVFNNRPTDCASCHMSNYNGAVPNHAASGFAASACATCHSTTTFAGAVFNHATTAFPLTGAHLATSCQSCHSDGVYHGKSAACASCHQSDYTGAALNHTAAGFVASNCTSCHSTATWSTGTFNHATTSFALTGSHVGRACADCHGDGVFNNRPTDCASCHMSNYNGAVPNHAASGFAASACATCHSTTTFAGAVFNHATTAFPLTGAHLATSCQSCHSDGVYHGKSAACASCHQSDYTGAALNHTAAGFVASNCTSCHSTATWSTGTFNHATTSFALTGSHVGRACADCHGDGVFNNRPTDCASCHMSNYNGAVPNHAASGFAASACATCHSTTTFAGAVFNHATTAFPLTGAHLATSCQSCHSDGVYHGKSAACASCHQSDYTGAALNHTAAGFVASNCTSCHSTATWTTGTYNHAATSFPLTGSHVTTNCRSCHTGTVFNNLAADCYSCHQQDYVAATPSHAASGFAPSACAGCHTTTTFTGAVFNHATTAFPLTGAHLSTTCTSCHGDGVYNGKPTACLSCHQANWSAATDPNHTAAGFVAAQCTTCHTTTTFTGARMATHDASYFRIYSGKHSGRWSGTCSTCHANSNNYAVFNCLGCHGQANTNSQHVGRSGYSYANTACYSCHSRV